MQTFFVHCCSFVSLSFAFSLQRDAEISTTNCFDIMTGHYKLQGVFYFCIVCCIVHRQNNHKALFPMFFFIATFHVHVTANGSKAAVKQWDSLGYYEPLNETTNHFPAWRLLSSQTVRYLYRYTNGKWFISTTIGGQIANIICKTPSDSPLSVGLKWRYSSDSGWADDDSLQVLKSERVVGE